MRPEDHDVHVLRIGGGKNHFRGVALPDQECRPGAGEASSIGEHPGAGLDARPLIVNPSQEPATGEAQAPRIDDAEDDKHGSGFDGQPDRLVGGAVGCRRQVGRQQEASDPVVGIGRRVLVGSWVHGVIIQLRRCRGQ